MAGRLELTRRSVDDDLHPTDPIPLDLLMDLAGIERRHPTVGRCLVIDPPPSAMDALCDWAADAIAAGLVSNAVLGSAVSIRLSAIESVLAERDRFAVGLIGRGVDIRTGAELADRWIDFGTPGLLPDRTFATALHFGVADIASDLAALIQSGRVGEILYVGSADWTVRVGAGPQRAVLLDYLTLQVVTSIAGVQLIKFELTKARPARRVVVPNGPVTRASWKELIDSEWAAASRSPVETGGRAARHGALDLPRDACGFPESSRGPVDRTLRTEAALLSRLSRSYLPMTDEDYDVGANPAPHPIWLASSDDIRDEQLDTVPYLSLQDVRDGSISPVPTQHVVITRYANGTVRPLDDLSPAMRRWIYARASDLRHTDAASPKVIHGGPWWGSPVPNLPSGAFVCLPVIGSHFTPVVMDRPVWTGPGIIWFEPHFLDANVLAALLVAGPLREQLRATSSLDEAGRRVLTAENLARLLLPKRVLPDDRRGASGRLPEARFRRVGAPRPSGVQR